MAFFATGRYHHQASAPIVNITNSDNSLNMTPGYLIFHPEEPNEANNPGDGHQKTQRATVIAFMGIFVFITLSLTTAIIVFCKKKNSVFFLQKSDLHADLDLELEEIQTDTSDDFGSFALEITDVGQALSEGNPQDLGQFEALISTPTNSLKQSKSLPLNINSWQKYKNQQQQQLLCKKSETCDQLHSSSNFSLTHCQIDSEDSTSLPEASEISLESSGLLTCSNEHSDKQTLSPMEHLYVFPTERVPS